MGDRWLTPREVATALGKSRASVLTLIERGEIKASDERVSLNAKPRYRIAESEIERWRESRIVVPTQPMPEMVRYAPRLKGEIARCIEARRQREAKRALRLSEHKQK